MYKRVRLKNSGDFQRCYKAGKTYKDPVVVLHVYDRKDEDLPRVGFSVSRKVGKAVQRNLVKRWMRESLRPLLPQLPNGVDMVFSARMRSLDAGFEPIKEGMLKLLMRSGMLRNETDMK